MACIHKKTFDIYHSDQLIMPDDYFEVDDEIAPSIQMLNRKGYITEWCCAGHPLLDWLMRSTEVEYEKCTVTPESYICFKEGVSLPVLPPGFVIYTSPPGFVDLRLNIRRYYHVDKYLYNYFEISRNIIEAMEHLYKWTLDLPIFNN